MAVDLVADKTVRVGHFPGSGFVQAARNISGASVAEGAVVILSSTGTNADVLYSFTTTTTQNAGNVMGVILDGPVENGAIGKVLRAGFADKVLVDGTDDIAAGDFLSTFTSAGISAKATNPLAAYAIALEAYATDDSNGKIKALILEQNILAQAFLSSSVGIGAVAPGGKLHVSSGASGASAYAAAADDLIVENSASVGITLVAPNTVASAIYFADEDDSGVARITYDHSSDSMIFRVAAATALTIDSNQMLNMAVHTDSNRGAAGTAGRVIYNSDDGKLNIDNGTNWTLPDGTTT